MRICLLALAVVMVACTSNSTPPTTGSSLSTTAPPVAATPPGPPPTVPPFEEIEVGLDPDGGHLVDGEGRSLYLFTLDDQRTSTCVDACAQAWPPLLGDPVATDGVDQSLLGNAERGDGSIQVTYAGHPLYLYSEDTAPGDTNGHGFNDVWFLVGPDGEPLD